MCVGLVEYSGLNHRAWYGRIHHPFLLSDNRHYTFYVWRRVFLVHPVVPYLLIPGYIACGWAWYIRIGPCLLYFNRWGPSRERAN